MRALVVALILAAASTAFADDAAERKARAAKLVDEASAAEKRADYATAIARLREAYDLIPHPALLYNLGQAHRLAGQPWDALEQYERYLAVEPKGPFAAKARGFVAALKKETAGKTRPVEHAPPPDPTPIEPVRPEPVKPRLEDPTPEPTPAPRGPSVPGWRRPVAIGLGVAGAAGLGAGIFYGLRARSISDELSGHDGPWTDPLLAKQAEGARAETRAIWLSAAGGALVLGGVVLFAIDAKGRGGAREVAITPVVDGRAVGLVVHGAL